MTQRIHNINADRLCRDELRDWLERREAISVSSKHRRRLYFSY